MNTTTTTREHYTLYVLDITKGSTDLKALCTMARSYRKLGVERYKMLALDIEDDTMPAVYESVLCKDCKGLLRDLLFGIDRLVEASLDEAVVVERNKGFAKRTYTWSLDSYLKDLAGIPDRLRKMADEIERKSKRYFPEGCDFDSLYAPLEASNGHVVDDRAARLGLELIHDLKWAYANIDLESVMRAGLELDRRGREALGK